MLSYLFAARGVPKRGPVRSRPPVDGTTARGGFGSRTAMMIFFCLSVCFLPAHRRHSVELADRLGQPITQKTEESVRLLRACARERGPESTDPTSRGHGGRPCRRRSTAVPSAAQRAALSATVFGTNFRTVHARGGGGRVQRRIQNLFRPRAKYEFYALPYVFIGLYLTPFCTRILPNTDPVQTTLLTVYCQCTDTKCFFNNFKFIALA